MHTPLADAGGGESGRDSSKGVVMRMYVLSLYSIFVFVFFLSILIHVIPAQCCSGS